MLKLVEIYIPQDKILPELLKTFSPEENYIMLKIGSESLIEGRKATMMLTSDEIEKKMKIDFEKNKEKFNTEIEIERRTAVLMQEKIAKMYDNQIVNLNKRLESALCQIELYQNENEIGRAHV